MTWVQEAVLTPADLETRVSLATAEGVEQNMRRWLRFVEVTQGNILELQALNVEQRVGAPCSWYAHARSAESALRLLTQAEAWHPKPPAIYQILNVVDPRVENRSAPDQWHRAVKGLSTSDRDIIVRTVLPIDFDVVRPKGTSTSEDEMALSVSAAAAVYDHLASIVGADAIAYGHSGNGRWLALALGHIPASDEVRDLVRSVLSSLSKVHGTSSVHIDQSLSDAKRLGPAWGTWKRKGSSTDERPHRRTAIVTPERTVRLSLSDLRNLAAALETKPQPRQSAPVALVGDGPFSRANRVSIADVARELGLYDGDGSVAKCPRGCEGGTSVVLLEDSNVHKCSHDTCSDAGPRGGGVRTPVDLWAEVRGLAPLEAAKELADAFGVGRPQHEPRNYVRAEALPPELVLTPADIVPLAEKPPLLRKWKTAAELAMEFISLGPGLPTGFQTLDEWTRGGLRQGKLVPIAGAPGAGKTLLATQLAHGYHDLGHPVAIYAVDESREGVMTRWGQQCGLVREDLEEAHPHTRQALAGCFASGLVDFIDPDEATLNEVGAWLLERSKGLEMAGVLVVDSLQTCRIAGGDTLDPRQRIDGVVKLLKDFRNDGLLVIATSEVSRSWYRGGADKVDPIAAFKESGSIEYALDVGILLESVKDEVGQVDVWVPKSRLGRDNRGEPAFRARIDFARASMSQIERPAHDRDAKPSGSSLDPVAIETVAGEILRALAATGSVPTRLKLERIVERGQRLTTQAVTKLLKDGRITGGRGTAYSVAPNVDVWEVRK